MKDKFVTILAVVAVMLLGGALAITASAQTRVAGTVAQADAVERLSGDRPEVVGIHLLLPAEHDVDPEQRHGDLLQTMEIGQVPLELRVVKADDVVEGILEAADGFDQIVIGASNERLLEQSLFGSIPQKVAEEAEATVVMVKRHDPVRFRLRRWLLARRSRNNDNGF